jgi:hypothetical protein
MQVAETADSPTMQQTFIKLADQWRRLASDLDDAYRLLEAVKRLDDKSTSQRRNFRSTSEYSPGERYGSELSRRWSGWELFGFI